MKLELIRLTAGAVCCWLVVSTASAQAPLQVAAQAQGLLDRHCVKCHGPLEQNAGLRLDSAEAVRKGGDEGPVVVAGKPDESKLIRVLASASDPHMPPKKQLADEDIARLRSWVTALADTPAGAISA